MLTWLGAHGRAARQALRRLAAQPLGATLSARVIGLALALPVTGLALFESSESRASSISGKPEVSLFLKDGTAADERARLERDRKSTRLNSKSPLNLVCRLLLE